VSDEDRLQDTDHLYELLHERARVIGGCRELRSCKGSAGWPTHGVYFFFEPGELRVDRNVPRVVRVGTHALTATSKALLWGRLRQHRGTAIGGNHRGSSFRLHIGSALIARASSADLLLSWLATKPTPGLVTEEHQVELAVSQYIGAMPFLWFGIPDRSQRVSIEADAIGLLSNLSGGLDPPSEDWLGHDAANIKVRFSGLWNVAQVDHRYYPRFLDLLERNLRG
jgi:hypothetical protein